MYTVKIQKNGRRYNIITPGNNPTFFSNLKTIDRNKRSYDVGLGCYIVSRDGLYHLIIGIYRNSKDTNFVFEDLNEREKFLTFCKKKNREKSILADNLSNELQKQKQNILIKDLNQDIDINYYKSFLEEGVTPYKYQCIGSKFLLHTLDGLLAMDMGTGKSITSILACEMAQDINKVLVIVPSYLRMNYQKEVIKFTKHKKVYVIGLNKKEQVSTIDEAKYIIVNYDFFSKNTKKFEEMYNQIIDTYMIKDVNVVILDEAHYIKNTDSNRTENIINFIETQKFKYKFLLTGTPIPSRITELYVLFKILCPSEIRNKVYFYETYCGLRYNARKKEYEQIGEPDLEMLNQKMNGLMFRVKKEQVLHDLPEKIVNDVIIEMTDEELRQYKDIENALKQFDWDSFSLKDTDNKKVYVLSILTRLRQFTSSIKFKYMKDIIPLYNRENQKVLVFDEYKGCLNALYEEFKDNSALYTGDDTDMISRQNKVDLFQSDSNELMNLFLTKQSGNAGLTLTKSSTIFDITLSYVPSVNEQCYSRAHRISQKNSVVVNKVLVANTIDEDINFLIKEKDRVIKAVIDNEKINLNEISRLDITDDLIKKLKNKYNGR